VKVDELSFRSEGFRLKVKDLGSGHMFYKAVMAISWFRTAVSLELRLQKLINLHTNWFSFSGFQGGGSS